MPGREAAIQSIKIHLDSDPAIAAVVPTGAHFVEGAIGTKPPAISFDVIDDPPRRVFGGRAFTQMQVSITCFVPPELGMEGAEALNQLVIDRLDGQRIGDLGVFAGRATVIDRGSAARDPRFNSVTNIFRLTGE